MSGIEKHSCTAFCHEGHFPEILFYNLKLGASLSPGLHLQLKGAKEKVTEQVGGLSLKWSTCLCRKSTNIDQGVRSEGANNDFTVALDR